MRIDDLKDAEAFQKHFVVPLVEAVRAEVRPLVENDKRQEERISRLETNQGRALRGLAVFAAILSVAMAAVMDWVKRKLRIT